MADYTAFTLYTAGLARIGLNMPDGMLDFNNPNGVTSCVRAGVIEFYLTHSWDFLLTTHPFNTAVGTAAYALPADVDQVLTAGVPSVGRQFSAIQAKNATRFTGTQSVPAYFYIGSGNINLVPTPSAVQSVSLLYYKTLTTPEDTSTYSSLYDDLAAIDYTTDMPDWVRPLAELYVAKQFALLLKDREMYQMIGDRIAETRRVLDDNSIRTLSLTAPQVRLDWYQ